MTLQLDLWKTEGELVYEQNLKTKKDLNTLRRGMFATMSELTRQIANLQKLYEEIKEEQERLDALLLKVVK